MSVAPDRLRSIPLLAGLSDQELAAFADLTEERLVADGQRMTPEGKSGYAFFVILDGSAEVRQGDEVIRTLTPGDYFGELALLNPDGRRTASVVATSSMTIAEVFGTRFRQLETDLPQVIERIRENAATYPDGS